MITKTMIALWISVFLLRMNFGNANECEEMMLRYNPLDLRRALTNCTSILGSLTIMSMEFGQDLNGADAVNRFHFPKLKEITGYLLLFNIIGLNSTGRLFPNLMVIRGQKLIQSYSMIFFGLPHLTEIGFKSLISIQRGYVFIERCPSLCFQNTIDWEALTDEDEEDLGAGKGNVIQEVTPKCPTKESCRSCNDHCWSAYHCQKNKTSHFITGVNYCHKSCLGGCTQNNTAEGCNVCSKLKLNGKCVDECPSDLFLFRDTMRCITKQKCLKLRLIPFKGECRRQCPDTYSQYNPATKLKHSNECFKCEVKCLERCFGAEIRGLSDLEHFRGCTIVDGSLSLRLGLNMTDINEKLEETLGNIEIINGSLRIYRSFSLTSLSFFRNLHTINADNATMMTKDNEEVIRNPYAIEVIENDNLQKLFDWKEKLYFAITGGGMSFHFNSKLCVNEIHALQDITKYDEYYDRAHDSIGYETNGYDEICHATGISAFHIVDSHSNVRIYWNITDFGTNRRLIGYFVYYIEATARNITYFSGLDACSTKKFRHSTPKENDMPMISRKSHSEIWQSVFVPYEDLTQDEGYFEMTLTSLKQYTQYAYYIRTQLSLRVKDQLINVTQGQSQVKYFKTLPDRPRPPIVSTKSKSNITLTLEWIPSTPEHELVQKYFIDVYVLSDEVEEIDKRNYCQDPKEKTDKQADVTKTPEVICCRDQRAYLEFFQRDSNQTCGESDLNCELTYEFVLFHHHVENALSKADLQKEPSKRYQHKLVSHESPTQHNGGMDPIKRKFGSDDSKYYLHSHIIDDKHVNSVLVPNLKPFVLYAFYVYACNNISNCSDYYFHSDRTEPYRDADDISIIAVPDERRTDIVTLIVQPPTEPNGVTVAYEIESYDYFRKIVNVTCLTRSDMEAMNYTVRIENLLYGTHSFRIRSVSLGEDGNFSQWVIVEVDQLSYNKYNWGVALAFIVIILIIIITTVFRKYKTYQSRRIHDSDYLLPERMDMDMDDTVVEHSDTTESPYQIEQPGQRQKRHPTEEEQPQQPSGSGDIQMRVFKSNVSSSPLDQPSTSSRPSTSSGIYEHQQPNTSFARQMYSQRNDRAPHQTHRREMKDTVFNFPRKTQTDSTDESDSEFSLFGQ